MLVKESTSCCSIVRKDKLKSLRLPLIENLLERREFVGEVTEVCLPKHNEQPNNISMELYTTLSIKWEAGKRKRKEKKNV